MSPEEFQINMNPKDQESQNGNGGNIFLLIAPRFWRFQEKPTKGKPLKWF